MKVWVIRHGESETNKNGLWTGWLDVPLTERGKEDAASASKIVSSVPFDRIYSSDLQRVKNTAEIAIPGCRYETTAMLREINVGTIAGKPLGIVKGPDNQPLNRDGYAAFGGESNDEFRDRIAAFMKSLDSADCENIAVFSHAGVLRKMFEITLKMELSPGTLLCRNCAVAIFDVKSSAWKLHSWINLH